MTPKKAFLYSLIVSVLLSAVAGIAVILTGSWGDLEIRIILTTITLAAASLAGLSCGAHFDTGHGRPLPLAGIALTLLGAAMVLSIIWLEIVSQAYVKLTVVTSVYAVAVAHLCLLSMARLSESFRWSLPAAYGVVLTVATLISLMLVFEIDNEGMFRTLAVAAILDAAVTILVPIFHRLSRNDLAPAANLDLARLDAEIAEMRGRLAQLEARRARAEMAPQPTAATTSSQA